MTSEGGSSRNLTGRSARIISNRNADTKNVQHEFQNDQNSQDMDSDA